jgi:hypothetical protein
VQNIYNHPDGMESLLGSLLKFSKLDLAGHYFNYYLISYQIYQLLTFGLPNLDKWQILTQNFQLLLTTATNQLVARPSPSARVIKQLTTGTRPASRRVASRYTSRW